MMAEDSTSSYEELALANELLNRGILVQILEATIAVIIILCAFGGNLLVCLAIYRNPQLRTLPNYYVTSLAVSDMLMSVLVMPLSLATKISSRWIFGDVVCQYQGFVGTLLGIVSLFTIALTALNRYFKIVRDEKYLVLYTRTKTLRSIAVVWLLASLVPVPYLSIGDRYRYHPGKCMCLFDLDNTNTTYALTTILCFVCVPFVVISFCYWRVFVKVRSHQKNMATPRQSAQFKSFSREIKITKLLLAIFVAFLLSWTPFVVIDVLGVILGQFSLARSAYVVYGFAVTLGSAVNPIIYGFMNQQFRNEFKAIIHLKIPCAASTPVIPIRITNQAPTPRHRCPIQTLGLSPASMETPVACGADASVRASLIGYENAGNILN